ncbi:pirin family protein [Diaminobutyricimonas sp. LJ205]|uniref:pirin family protein n=1 Tax=Diaminobutyricimonas sp. LJ205 TaxID=2683590 RepID=UPI0012F4F878|nr:pirin family protein [Diaminobutyricimonas sp. LJ205]
MSNLETDPQELICEDEPGNGRVEILEPREVPLGGPRAMPVRRTLPQRGRSLIGPWCFVDHYGPDPVAMDVPPHPHTGLQTVSWLFAGEIEHHDSSGGAAIVRPGELNLMTAGRGIQHSEVSVSAGSTSGVGSTTEVGLTSGSGSTGGAGILHGAQLWTALPDEHRHAAPFFERYVPPVTLHQGARVSVFLGSLLGQTSTARAFSPIVGAQIDLPPNTEIALPVDPSFEHGVLVDSGAVTVDDETVPAHALGYRAPGAETLVLAAGDEPARLLLIGGTPFGEQIVMWWNFIGRSHDEVVAFREEWQRDVIDGQTDAGRFGRVDGYDRGGALPAPTLPTVRLKPRG